MAMQLLGSWSVERRMWPIRPLADHSTGRHRARSHHQHKSLLSPNVCVRIPINNGSAVPASAPPTSESDNSASFVRRRTMTTGCPPFTNTQTDIRTPADMRNVTIVRIIIINADVVVFIGIPFFLANHRPGQHNKHAEPMTHSFPACHHAVGVVGRSVHECRPQSKKKWRRISHCRGSESRRASSQILLGVGCGGGGGGFWST